ncbi:hypothetical protein P8452_52612 [Trifolium repens]|nr:hypothetical protein P8452_52612 [Trifolium repens]
MRVAAGIKRINLDGLWRQAFDTKGQCALSLTNQCFIIITIIVIFDLGNVSHVRFLSCPNYINCCFDFALIGEFRSSLFSFSLSSDVEVWIDKARKQYLIKVGRDIRPIMRGAYTLFKDGGDPEKVNCIVLRKMITLTIEKIMIANTKLLINLQVFLCPKV